MRLPRRKRDVVLGEDVGEALDFAGVRDGEQNLIALSGELLDFFEHRRNRAVEARSGLREESARMSSSSPRVMPRCSTSAPVSDATFFHQSSGGKIQICGADEIADAAAFVGFFDAGPEAVEFGAEQVGFVEQDRGVRQQIEDGAVGSGDGSVELPTGKDGDAAGADGGFDDFFRAR